MSLLAAAVMSAAVWHNRRVRGIAVLLGLAATLVECEAIAGELAMTRRGGERTVSAWHAALAGFRFHAGAGGRVALRNTWMGVVVTLFSVIVVAPNPVGVVHALARSLTVAGEPPGALFVMAACAVALSRDGRIGADMLPARRAVGLNPVDALRDE